MFERYRNIVDDWQDFADCTNTPLPTTIRVNTLRTSRKQVRTELALLGIEAEPVAFLDDALTVSKEARVGRTWLYHAGHIHLQELVSMLPARALPIEQGQSVLDMCAAPGNKSAQVALRLANTGSVWANDVSPGRIHALKGVFDHQGIVNAAVMTNNAMTMQTSMLFDHVIADVPCTCEGTIRKKPELADAPPTLDAYERYHNIQKTILHRAIELTRNGGHVVYSTCTFAPEENEGVVSAVLGEREDVEVIPISFPGMIVSPGIKSWEQESFHPDVEKTIRVWPHHNNTGGFYVALLRKKGPALVVAQDKLERVTQGGVRDYVYASLHGRFGIDTEILDSHYFFEVGAKKIAVTHPEAIFPAGTVVSRGMSVCKTGRHIMKPSTQVATYLGPYMSRNVIAMNATQMQHFLQRKPYELDNDQEAQVESDGLVACSYRGVVLGIAQAKDNIIQSLFPKAWVTAN